MKIEHINALLNVFVSFEQDKAVHALMDKLIKYSADGAYMDAGFVVGPSHTGKSGAVLDYIQGGRDFWDRDKGGLLRDFVYVRIQQGGTNAKSMMIQILEALGDPAPEDGNERQLTKRAKQYLKGAGVKLLILDEFQQLVEKKRTQKAIYQIADVLKGFLDEGICPILIVGIDNIIDLLSVNEQFVNRVANTVELVPFDISTPEQFEDYQVFVWQFLQQTPIQFQDAASEEMVRRIYEATDGYVGKLGKLLKRSAEVANEAEAEIVSAEHMAVAWAQNAFVSRGRVNPFLMSIQELMAIQEQVGRQHTLVDEVEG